MSWETKKLGDIATVISGATPKTGVDEYWDGEIAWATPKDLSKLGQKYIDATESYITEMGYRSCSTVLLPHDSVLLSSRAPIGHVAVNTIPMATNQGFKSLIPNREVLDSNYLYHWLKSQTAFLNSLGRGATFKEISKSIVENIEVPLPPLPVQRRIAAVLDEVDALRQKRERSIEQLTTLEQVGFYNIISGYMSDWEENAKQIADIEKFITSGSRGWAQYYSNEGEVFLRIQNVGKHKLLLDDLTYVNPPESAEARRTKTYVGDLVISITADIGRCGVIDDEISGSYISQHLSIVRQNHFLPVYLSAFISSPFGQRQIQTRNKGGVKAGLNFDDLRSLRIADVPMDIQEKYQKYYESVRFMQSELETSFREIKTLNHSLQSRAFSGELALRDLEAVL